MSSNSAVLSDVLIRNADNLVVWLRLNPDVEASSHAEKLSLINAEVQEICNDFISTLDDAMHKKSPRPNPTPRIFIEQGSDLSRILWLHWES